MHVQDHLVWIDMEMSGLDVGKERILEIAILVTDGQLEIIAEGPELVVNQPDALLASMDDWNRSHHGSSGLTERVKNSTVTEKEAEDRVLAFLTNYCPPRMAPLAGNSVHQDRLFLAKYMPRVEKFLHYRNVDVSTIKELGKRWYPKTIQQKPQKKASHRALADIRESLEELKYYRKLLFVTPESLGEAPIEVG